MNLIKFTVTRGETTTACWIDPDAIVAIEAFPSGGTYVLLISAHGYLIPNQTPEDIIRYIKNNRQIATTWSEDND